MNTFTLSARSGRQFIWLACIGLVSALVSMLAWRVCYARQKPHTGAPSRYTNHLIDQTSPYLLEHAHNPVDWYPWGAEALAKAKRENKPIFLSIGYSACHWCHVMAREDFENEEIAGILNANFVAIKVDREQRPDIDAQYMLAVQMMGRGGGWPLSVFMLPDTRPFYGGTYYPPDDFKRLLLQVLEAYRQQPERLRNAANRIADALSRASASVAGGKPDRDASAQAVALLTRSYDAAQGGFSRQPKFPEAPELAFLLARYHKTGDKRLLRMVTNTLDHMADGGIYDQLGGGFHRYSTDAFWRVPHFEKMLYDQALLVPIYLDAYRSTFRPRYRQVVRETLAFVARELRDPNGGFYSTLDADSEGVEGKYYLWTPAQVRAALGSDARLFDAIYGVTEAGDLEGKSVLHLAMPLTEAARARGLAPVTLEYRLEGLRQKLLAARGARVRPHTDDKALASWNGLMIAAYARAYQAIGDPAYRRIAEEAADFVARNMTRDGRLLHSYRMGKADVPGLLEDYADTAYGLLSLYDATRDTRWLDRAETTARQMTAQFADTANGGFYSVAVQGELLARLKEGEDSALPSANGVAALVLARLAVLRGKSWREPAIQTVEAFQPLIAQAPGAFATLLTAYESLDAPAEMAKPQSVTLRIMAISAPAKGAVTVSLDVTVRSGWHINAHQTSAAYLIPTTLRLTGPAGAKLERVRYPQPRRALFGYAKEPLAVYQGETVLQATVRLPAPARTGDHLRFTLSYQPCNERACLQPAETTLEAPLPTR